MYGPSWTPLWIYVSAAAGMVLATGPAGRRIAITGVAAVSVCYTFFGWLSHLSLGTFLISLLPVLLVGMAGIGFRILLVLLYELAQARETVAYLAANEERLRLARDMHDLTGQSLSMITLKSELAAKRLAQLPPALARDAVLTELGDIGRVSRQTLHDIREAVSGYHKPTLAVEVITARNALEAAGIRLEDDAELTLRSGSYDHDTEAALAWCLREAVTNVIRHSGGESCRIRLIERGTELSLVVTDDGRGFTEQDGRGTAADGPVPGPDAPDLPHPGSAGNGLLSMSERLSAAGGRLSLGPAEPGRPGHPRGFRLTATIPAPAAPTIPAPAAPTIPAPAAPTIPAPAAPTIPAPAAPAALAPAAVAPAGRNGRP
jgi:two-component system sensor histidine kinase DesK